MNKLDPESTLYNVGYPTKFELETEWTHNEFLRFKQQVLDNVVSQMDVLFNDTTSTRAITLLGERLVSVQFQLTPSRLLFLTATWTYQHENYDKPHDEKLINHIASLALTVLNQKGYEPAGVGIYNQVAHITNKSTTNIVIPAGPLSI